MFVTGIAECKMRCGGMYNDYMFYISLPINRINLIKYFSNKQMLYLCILMFDIVFICK